MGFAFLKYEDQRSTILAVDNFNGIKLLDRTLRCDHVDKYKLPKEVRQKEEEELEMNPNAEVKLGPGHAYKSQDLENHYDIASGIDLWARQQTSSPTEEPQRKHKKHKKEEKKHKKEKKRHRRDDESVAAVYVSSVEGGRALTRPDTAGSSTFATQLSGPAAAVDPNASWRGRMEPALRAQEESERRRVASGIEGGNRREEFDGFGGMKRRR
jgi:RNA-binding motif X-linked protein 2